MGVSRSADRPFSAHLSWSTTEPRSSAVLLDESQDAAPGVVAGVLPLLERAVEEAVGRSLVDVHLVRHLRLGELAVELDKRLSGARGIGAGDQQKERFLHPRDVRFNSHRTAIKADDTVGVRHERGKVPRARPAEAKADSEHRLDGTAVLRSEMYDRSLHVGRNIFLRRLLDMRHEFERLAAIADACRAAEIVDGYRVDPGLGEALRELLVEMVQAADVGHDDHAGTGRLFGACEVGAELRAICGGEDQVTLVGGGAAYGREGRAGVV